MSALPPIALEVIALAGRTRALLARGELAGLTVALPDAFNIVLDAEHAARLVLADVEHCVEATELRRQAEDDDRWRRLAAQLRAIERAAREAG